MAIVMKKPSQRTPLQANSPAVEPDGSVPAALPEALPLVALREGVIFPHAEVVLVFGRAHSQLAIEAAEAGQGHIVVVAQKELEKQKLTPKDLYRVGTLAKIERTLKQDNELHVLLHGISRVEIQDFTQLSPYFAVTHRELPDTVVESDELKAQLNHLTTLFRKAIQQGKPVDFLNFMKVMGGMQNYELLDHVASTLDLPTAEKQQLLEELSVNVRMEKVLEILSQEQHILDIEQKIVNKTKKRLDERMRENILRERMQVIQKELGELDEEEELSELEQQIAKAGMPKEVEEKARKELRRMGQMSPMHSEYAYLSTWLETLLSVPWKQRSRGRTSLGKAAEILDRDHYGLEKVKERILEHLAVLQLEQAQVSQKAAEKKPEKPARKLKPAKRTHLSTILCFVGPPGVGKTSIGRSIATALGRNFVKVSLGGVHDEAEIRGHRRTYVGAMPGRIMQGIIQAKSTNPVVMLDEVDKLGSDFRGDPSAALLETLDPEQNYEFTDHYLGVPYDLSNVIFITTANMLDTIPPALRDRLEVVEYSGYTHDEKFMIAHQYLVPQVREGAHLAKTQFSITDEALHVVIRNYTREAGVRNLKRELSKLARKAARQIAEKQATSVKITLKNLETLLGPPRVLETLTEREPEVGLVNGLAWTSTGGDILPIEAALSKGKPGFTLTGQLGEVMQESAKAAFTYVRTHAEALNIEPELFNTSHVHIHVPEGAVPKDGPSAGLAMATVIASIFTKRAIRHDIAMTGEVTLRGRALPIGGLKEKLIAAHRAGAKEVFIPDQNVKDLVEVPENVRKDLKITSVDRVEAILEQALLAA